MVSKMIASATTEAAKENSRWGVGVMSTLTYQLIVNRNNQMENKYAVAPDGIPRNKATYLRTWKYKLSPISINECSYLLKVLLN